MRKPYFVLLGILICAGAAYTAWDFAGGAAETRFSDVEPGFEEPEEHELGVTETFESSATGTILGPVGGDLLPTGPGLYAGWSRYWQEFSPAEELLYSSWKRPPGPARVGIQAGHWKVADAP